MIPADIRAGESVPLGDEPGELRVILDQISRMLPLNITNIWFARVLEKECQAVPVMSVKLVP